MANDDSFNVPNFLHYSPLKESDIPLIKSLSQKLEKAGVLDYEDEKMMDRPENSGEFFKEATDNALYEKELNSEFHHQGLEDELFELNRTRLKDFDNPSLDGIDDYGEQIYDDGRFQ